LRPEPPGANLAKSLIRPMNPLALSRLLQLASPALPVGAYTYSQGLEWAIEQGSVRSEADAGRWIGDVLEHSLGAYELPLLFALSAAWKAAARPPGGTAEADADDAVDTGTGTGANSDPERAAPANRLHAEIRRLNHDFLVTREAAELLAESAQMGHSLLRLLREFPELPASTRQLLHDIEHSDQLAFPTVWSALAAAWDIDPKDSAAAYAWTWAENQVMAALKAVPLGQSAGQRLLHALGARLPAIVTRAATLEPDDWSNFMPGLAIASARHETQYSRLFRS
jgi:urease accessory protein